MLYDNVSLVAGFTCYNRSMAYTIPDRFKMDRETAVFVAKKYLKESIYRSAHLEGMAVTFPQTEAILENWKVSGVLPKDILKVCDLRDAWKYILENLDEAVNLKFLMDLHTLIAKEDVVWNMLGTLRTTGVRITGTSYLPEVPNAEKIHADLLRLLENKNETDRAIEVGLYIMRTQPFMDGNKRVGTLVANRLLIADGRGIFSIPDDKAQEFSEKLVRFYESNDSGKIKEFVYEFCLTGT